MREISVDQEKCTLCQACIETCPMHLFFMEDSKVLAHNEEQCIACGHCVSVCPVEAVIHKGLDPTGFLSAPERTRLSSEALYYFLRSRRSCRSYEARGVPKDMLEKLIDIGRFAPSGRNSQDCEFIVIQDKNKIEKLSKMAGSLYGTLVKQLEAGKENIPLFLRRAMYGFRLNYEFSLEGRDRIFRGAPVVILVHAPTDNIAAYDNSLYAVFHMVMMAQTLGLGTCINRFFLEAADRVPEIPRELEVPPGHKVFGCVTVGFPKYKFHKFPSRNPAKAKWI